MKFAIAVLFAFAAIGFCCPEASAQWNNIQSSNTTDATADIGFTGEGPAGAAYTAKLIKWVDPMTFIVIAEVPGTVDAAGKLSGTFTVPGGGWPSGEFLQVSIYQGQVHRRSSQPWRFP